MPEKTQSKPSTTSRSRDVQKQSVVKSAAKHPLTDLHQSIGNRAVQRLIHSPYIQTKLQVTPDDQLEDEAEKTSDAVMRSTDSATTKGVSSSPRSSQTGSSVASQNLQHRLTSSSSSSSLPDAVREFMEPRLGADLGGVKIHTGQDAADMSDQLHAQAFTYGQDIYYGAGKSPGKDALTAHELAHVVQQTGDGQLQQGNPKLISLNPDEEKKKREAKAAALSVELQRLIDGAVWKEIRKRVYPKESAAGVKRAKERKEGKRPDLTGLGKVSVLERFAKAIKKVQSDWAKLSVDDRVKAIGDAANAELTTASVPPFLIVGKEKMEIKGYFDHALWRFVISEDLVKGASLSNADAGEVANTALHEGRHAEQQFLAARYSAGPPDKKSAAAIVLEQGIPDSIAKKAVAAKFDAKTDASVASLGKDMYKATVTEGAVNQKISDDDYTKEMEEARKKAVTSLTALKAAATEPNINDATAKRDTLKAAIAEVERRYTLYRNIPYEFDAHEVGDAAEEAFKGWP